MPNPRFEDIDFSIMIVTMKSSMAKINTEHRLTPYMIYMRFDWVNAALISLLELYQDMTFAFNNSNKVVDTLIGCGALVAVSSDGGFYGGTGEAYLMLSSGNKDEI